METFPSKLPKCTNDYSADVLPTMRRTEMDDGSIRQESRFTSVLGTSAFSWVFNGEEFEIFQAWVKYKISNGADWFLISLPNGTGFVTTKVRFKDGKYTVKHQPVMHWKVSASFEYVVATALSEAQLNAKLA